MPSRRRVLRQLFVASEQKQAFAFFAAPVARQQPGIYAKRHVRRKVYIASWMFTWLFFTAVYVLIPNTKVKFHNAFIAGVFAGTGFMILQWLFVTGQVYVTRYNAIYGSFAFMPLLLIWLQLTWLVTLSGAVLCYSSQNIFQFSFSTEIAEISRSYRERVTLAVATIIVKKFVDQEKPPTRHDISMIYGIPSRLVADIIDQLVLANIINPVILNAKNEIPGYQPAIDPSLLTVELVVTKLSNLGRSDFIPDFNENFQGIVEFLKKVDLDISTDMSNQRLMDLEIVETPKQREHSKRNT